MDLKIVRGELPNHEAVRTAIRAFVHEIDVKGDEVGFYQQTCNSVHSAVYRGNGDFWVSFDESGEVEAYVLGHVTTEVDNQLTYWLAQAWVNHKVRGKREVKDSWQRIREQAKKYLCKHIVVVSGRGTKAYCRWLGQGWHEYATLLKEDI